MQKTYMDSRYLAIDCCSAHVFGIDFNNTFRRYHFKTSDVAYFGWDRDLPKQDANLKCANCNKQVITIETIKIIESLYALSGIKAVSTYLESLNKK